MTDDELQVLQDLTAAKASYKEDWGELSAVRSEVEYTAGLVETCKRELGEDFRTWQQLQQPQVGYGCSVGDTIKMLVGHHCIIHHNSGSATHTYTE